MNDPGPLLVGLGSHDRGDDAVGPAVAEAVSALGLPGVCVVEQEDPTNLVDLWAGRQLVVVVDAVCSGGVVGSLLVLETGQGDLPLPRSAWAASGRGGTHAFGLGAAVELSRALGRLPRRLVVVGVEAGGFEHGRALTPPVARSLPRTVEVVTRLLEEAAVSSGTTSSSPRGSGDTRR